MSLEKHSILDDISASFAISYLYITITISILYSHTFYKYLYPRYQYISIIILCFLIIVLSRSKINIEALTLSLFLAVTSIVNSIFNKLPFGDLLPTVQLAVLIYTFSTINLSIAERKILRISARCIWCYLVLYTIMYYGKIEMYLEMTDNDSILNPNTIGIGLAISYCAFHALDSEYEKSNNRLLFFIITCVCIILCRNRTGLLFYFIIEASRSVLYATRHFVRYRSIIIFIIVGGFLFPIVIVAAWRILGGEFMLLGKYLFTGRERIWSTMIELMEQNPNTFYFGIGKNEIVYWHGRFNLHNSYLAFHAQYGLITSILLYVTVVLSQPLNRDGSFFINIDVLLLVSLILLLSYSETLFTYPLTTFYLAVPVGLSLSKRHPNSNTISYGGVISDS